MILVTSGMNVTCMYFKTCILQYLIFPPHVETSSSSSIDSFSQQDANLTELKVIFLKMYNFFLCWLQINRLISQFKIEGRGFELILDFYFVQRVLRQFSCIDYQGTKIIKIFKIVTEILNFVDKMASSSLCIVTVVRSL